MQFLAGTSGYSYTSWRGSFYAEDTRPEDMLSAYALELPTVEINNTFYRMPRTSVLETWKASVPNDFRFVIKASRRITHQARLAGVEQAVDYLTRGVSVLEDNLGAVLFQLPPNLRKDGERLRQFLAYWPAEIPAAMEFRNPSWLDDETLDLLREHNVALCVSDDGKLRLPDVLDTTDWLYLRLRRPEYSARDLADWLKQARATQAERAFVFFKHEEDAAGPQMAQRFLKLARRPSPKRAPRIQRRRSSTKSTG